MAGGQKAPGEKENEMFTGTQAMDLISEIWHMNWEDVNDLAAELGMPAAKRAQMIRMRARNADKMLKNFQHLTAQLVVANSYNE